MARPRWKRAVSSDLEAIGIFLRSREAEAAGCIGRLLHRDAPGGGVLRLPPPHRGFCCVAVEPGQRDGQGRGDGPVLGLVLKTSSGVLFPLLPRGPVASTGDAGLPRGLADGLASLVGTEEDVSRFEGAMGMKPIVSVAYELMSREPEPLPAAPGIPAFRSRRATEDDLDALFPLQEAYELEEVITVIHRFDAAGCRAALRKALREQVIHIGMLDGVAVAKAATNARSFGLDQLGGIFVAPPYRRRGLGRLIVSGLVGELAATGRGTSLFVKSANEAARGLYEELGFAARGPFRADYFVG